MPSNRIEHAVVDASNQLMHVFLADGKVMTIDLDADGLPTGDWSQSTQVPIHNLGD